MTSTKQNLSGTTDLVAAVSDAGQILPGRIDLAPAVASASFQAESESGAAASRDQTSSRLIDPESAAARAALQAESAGVDTAAPALVVDGTPVAEFEVIWGGRLSTSPVPADDSQWRWLRGQGVNTIVNLDGVMFDFGQYAFESFLWMPLGAGEPPTEEGARRLLRFVQQCDNQPAHISGAARDARAAMVTLVRYAIDGWSIEAALAEGRRLNGGAALSPQQVTWLLDWAATHPPGSDRLDSCLGL